METLSANYRNPHLVRVWRMEAAWLVILDGGWSGAGLYLPLP